MGLGQLKRLYSLEVGVLAGRSRNHQGWDPAVGAAGLAELSLFRLQLAVDVVEAQRRNGSSVLVLDNPIGTASRLSFLEMQREVASAMNVQPIYATAVNDLNAVGALENVIRLRNTRADRRTGRRFIEVDPTADGTSREVDAVRMVFDAAPSSTSEPSGVPQRSGRQAVDHEVPDDTRTA
jgi:hypothetical protein